MFQYRETWCGVTIKDTKNPPEDVRVRKASEDAGFMRKISRGQCLMTIRDTDLNGFGYAGSCRAWRSWNASSCARYLPRSSVAYCLKYWAEGIVCCICGTCIVPTEYIRLLTKEKFDALTIPYFNKEHDMVLAAGRLKHSASVAKRRVFFRRGRQNNFCSILQRFQQHDTCRESQQAIGWDEDICRRLDKIASEDHSYIAT